MTTHPLDDQQQASLNAVLYDAVEARNVERVKLCLSRGAETGPVDMSDYWDNRSGEQRPLAVFAYQNYDKDVFAQLVSGGMPLEERDSDGDTALAWAVRDQRYNTVRDMLQLGASPLSANDDNKTILELARAADKRISIYREEIIDALLGAMTPAAGFNKAAAKSAAAPESAVETAEDLVVGKPISLTSGGDQGGQKKGFHL